MRHHERMSPCRWPWQRCIPPCPWPLNQQPYCRRWKETDLGSFCEQRGIELVGALIARHAGYARRQHQAFGAGLVAHFQDGLRFRADEHQPGVQASLRKAVVLGQEAVAGGVPRRCWCCAPPPASASAEPADKKTARAAPNASRAEQQNRVIEDIYFSCCFSHTESAPANPNSTHHKPQSAANCKRRT